MQRICSLLIIIYIKFILSNLLYNYLQSIANQVIEIALFSTSQLSQLLFEL